MLTKALWRRAGAGNVTAITCLIRIMERRAKLLGLDGMPQLDFDDEVRALATQEGLDPEETVRAAAELAKGWEGS